MGSIQHEVSGCISKNEYALNNNDYRNCLPGTNATLQALVDRLASDPEVARWIELPMICVMGDTSSGKSSLLSNLCMVELPSSHKMTTRCPILIRMKRSDEQLARISIQWRSEGTFPEFPEQCITNNDWDTIPTAIFQAQEFILNHTSKDVAQDIVCLNVQGPRSCTTDLTLLDLPGLVRSKAVDESASLPEDIQHLVDLYLKNPRSIILAVHAASNDFHNSQIMADAMQVDPQTTRTIPVLTKPDLIDPGAEDSVVEVLLGKKLDFTLGFHIVKGRGQAAREQKTSIQDGLDDETNFFRETEPWKSIPDRTYFGTAQLRNKLGELQMSMIRQSLPSIIQEARQRHKRAQMRLCEMGEMHHTMSARRRYYQDLCQSLISKLKASLSGKGSRTKNHAASLHEACSAFMQAIREGSLSTIRTIVEGAQVIVASPHGTVRGEVVHLDQTFACVDFVDEGDRKSEVLFEKVGSASEEFVEENVVWSDGTKVYIARKDNVCDTLRKISLSSIRTDPTWLKEKISQNRTDELACFLNIDIFKNIVEEFIEEDWRPHCNSLVQRTQDIVQAAVHDAMREILSTDRYPALRSLIERQCRQATQALVFSAQKQVESHLQNEKHPYTQDSVLFENISEVRHRNLRRELEVALRLDQEGVYDTQAIKIIMDDVFVRNQQKSMEDHMAEEMEIVLESYGQIATRRVIDRTPMVCWEVVRSLAGSVQESLWEVTDDTLCQCMQDSPSFVAEHKAAQEEFSAMEKALSTLDSLATLP